MGFKCMSCGEIKNIEDLQLGVPFTVCQDCWHEQEEQKSVRCD